MSFYSDHTRQSQTSPSVSLEKGAYRMRGPTKREMGASSAFRPRRDSKPSKDPPALRYEKQMAILVVFLICATVTCFASAYYLFTTRWSVNHPTQAHSASDNIPLQVVDFETDFSPGSPSVSGISGGAISGSEEKFLAYLPHSGFHNQRIAFENALVLSRLLNRTLLVPPVRLGSNVLHYAPFEDLQKTLVATDKRSLKHCRSVVDESPVEECITYNEYTQVPWSWLVDLSPIEQHQKLLPRWNFTNDWLQDALNITEENTFTLLDTYRDTYGYQDFISLSASGGRKYQYMVHLSTLALRRERLVHLGSLFGSSRLHLRDLHNFNLRKLIRADMARLNPLLDDIASSVQQDLGDHLLGAHIRTGDGTFKDNIDSNARLIWWKLIHGALGYSKEETLALERQFTDIKEITADVLSQPPSNLPPDEELHELRLTPLEGVLGGAENSCEHRAHLLPGLSRLNIPMFISTDLVNPRTDPAMSIFIRTFPCVAFLSDFPKATAPLDVLQNGIDGLLLKPFLLPFVDALVVARAERVVGTEGSTFSYFVEDVLWRTLHGYNITQKG